jgi:hypothetical protein
VSKVKIVRDSSVMPYYIQFDISLREARLISEGHENLTAILMEDIRKALKYAESLDND